MHHITDITTYLRTFSHEIGEQVVSRFPPLHRPGEAASPFLARLLRRPFPGQELAIMGIVKAWQQHSGASAIAECGTGKTLIALASLYAHAEGRSFTAVAMVPPQLVLKWARVLSDNSRHPRVFDRRRAQRRRLERLFRRE